MLYIKFAKSFLTAETPSPAVKAITTALGGDQSWIPCTEAELCCTVDLLVTPTIQEALSSDENVWEWDDELTQVWFETQFDSELGPAGTQVLALVPFWHCDSDGLLRAGSPICGHGGPLGWGGATVASIEANGGRLDIANALRGYDK